MDIMRYDNLNVWALCIVSMDIAQSQGRELNMNIDTFPEEKKCFKYKTKCRAT